MLDDSTNGNVVKRRFVESFFQIWANPSKRKFRLACIRHRVDSGPLRPHGKGFQDLATPKSQNHKKQWRKCARKRGHAKKCNTEAALRQHSWVLAASKHVWCACLRIEISVSCILSRIWFLYLSQHDHFFWFFMIAFQSQQFILNSLPPVKILVCGEIGR